MEEKYNSLIENGAWILSDPPSDKKDCSKQMGVEDKSRKQCTAALSNTEAEYIALGEATMEAIYLKALLSELFGENKFKTLFNDNQSAQKLLLNPDFHSRSKHTDVHHYFIRGAVDSSHVNVMYKPTSQMNADVMTKCLNGPKRHYCADGLGLQSLQSHSIEGEC
jgi:hypothetical protein